MSKKKNRTRTEPEPAREEPQLSGETVRAVAVRLGEPTPGIGRLHEMIVMQVPVEVAEQYKVGGSTGDQLPSCIARATTELEKVWR